LLKYSLKECALLYAGISIHGMKERQKVIFVSATSDNQDRVLAGVTNGQILSIEVESLSKRVRRRGNKSPRPEGPFDLERFYVTVP
jgi:hypothetical protein